MPGIGTGTKPGKISSYGTAIIRRMCTASEREYYGQFWIATCSHFMTIIKISLSDPSMTASPDRNEWITIDISKK